MTTTVPHLPPRRTLIPQKDAPDWTLLPGDGNEDPERIRAEGGLFGTPLAARSVVGGGVRSSAASRAAHDVDLHRLHNVQPARLRGRKSNAERFRATFWIALVAVCAYGWYRLSRG